MQITLVSSILFFTGMAAVTASPINLRPLNPQPSFGVLAVDNQARDGDVHVLMARYRQHSLHPIYLRRLAAGFSSELEGREWDNLVDELEAREDGFEIESREPFTRHLHVGVEVKDYHLS
ncbi:unnamed protein product [Cyclocybe aegerita]|uniref:Inhibitor I9 domain-containing protein n=1 Tax=Cyclocybe aegerita TaxID=1973307 RepID=A0A8S0VTT5_CYCAE|nr:unnamed protein product [Cyclocybe aegerita]